MYTCELPVVIFYYTTIIVFSLLVVLVIWTLYKYILFRKHAKMSKLLYFIGLSFYVILLILFITAVAMSFFVCRVERSSPLWKQLYAVYALELATHWNSLIILLFFRLYYCFKSSSFGLSNLSIMTFVMLYLIFIGSIFASPYSDFAYTVVFLCIPTIVFYVSFLFIFKLRQINQNQSNENGQQMLSTITKFTVLSICAITSTVLLAIMILLITLLLPKNMFLTITTNSLFMIDLVTNFTCISLSYRFNEKYYLFICGVMDKCCRRCCGNNVSSVQHELSTYVNSTTSTQTKTETDQTV
eukprot:122478_1